MRRPFLSKKKKNNNNILKLICIGTLQYLKAGQQMTMTFGDKIGNILMRFLPVPQHR
jgi:hypothetical protein